MKLITKEIEKKLRANVGKGFRNTKPWLKLFTPFGSATWLISELHDHGEDIHLFGLCDLGMGYPELGYISLKEIEDLNKSVEDVQNQTKSFKDSIYKPKRNQSKDYQGSENLKDKLEYLRELLDSGLITKAEYDKNRFKLLDQI